MTNACAVSMPPPRPRNGDTKSSDHVSRAFAARHAWAGAAGHGRHRRCAAASAVGTGSTSPEIPLIGYEGVWNVDVDTELLKILADHPEVRVERPEKALYRAIEAAELGEAGALAALVALKLSENVQFRDPPGACKLIETAVDRGDQAWRSRREACRGS